MPYRFMKCMHSSSQLTPLIKQARCTMKSKCKFISASDTSLCYTEFYPWPCTMKRTSLLKFCLTFTIAISKWTLFWLDPASHLLVKSWGMWIFEIIQGEHKQQWYRWLFCRVHLGLPMMNFNLTTITLINWHQLNLSHLTFILLLY